MALSRHGAVCVLARSAPPGLDGFAPLDSAGFERWDFAFNSVARSLPRLIKTSYDGPIMLNLKSASPQRWLQQVDQDLDQILIDHAHCEKKAAGVAMHLIFAYVDHEELCQEMTTIVNEELEHFHMVLEILKRREIGFQRLKPGAYGRRLHECVRKLEPQRAIDRLLVAGLIEARSCERFSMLRDHVEDPELSDFYGSLFESEARHHTTYVRLATTFGPEAQVYQRLSELADREAVIVAEGDPLPRMHS
jgi:tRNA-(ms[2]io[6]A)-hydroxylase